MKVTELKLFLWLSSIINIVALYFVIFQITDSELKIIVFSSVTLWNILYSIYLSKFYNAENNRVHESLNFMGNENIRYFEREIALRDQISYLQEENSILRQKEQALSGQVNALQGIELMSNQIEGLLKEKINILIRSIKECHTLTRAKWYYDFWTEVKNKHKDILVEENLVEASSLTTTKQESNPK